MIDKLTVCKQTLDAKVITFTEILCIQFTFVQKSENVICGGNKWK